MLSRNNWCSGLTLLEVMISVFILSIILTIVYGAYTSNVDAIQKAKIDSEVDQVARIILDRISKDLQSALVDTSVSYDKANVKLGMVGSDGQANGQPSDRIDFTCLSHFMVGNSGIDTDLCEVGYYLEEDPDNQEAFILFRRDDPTPDDDLLTGGISLQLAKGVKGLDFKFQTEQGEMSDNWNTIEGEPSEALPSLVKVEIRVLDSEGNIHNFSTSVHPMMASEK